MAAERESRRADAELLGHSVIGADADSASMSAASEAICRRARSLFEAEALEPPAVVLIEMMPSRPSMQAAAEPGDDDAKVVASTRHDRAKYERYYATIAEYFETRSVSTPVGVGVHVPVRQTKSTGVPVWSKARHTAAADGGGDDAPRAPSNQSHAAAPPSRIGAFEVYLAYRLGNTTSGGSGSIIFHLVHSKLTTYAWPNVATLFARVEALLQPLWADRALTAALHDETDEQADLRWAIEAWGADASRETHKTAREQLDQMVAADERLGRLLDARDVEALRRTLESPHASLRGGSRSTRHLRRCSATLATLSACSIWWPCASYSPPSQRLERRARADSDP